MPERLERVEQSRDGLGVLRLVPRRERVGPRLGPGHRLAMSLDLNRLLERGTVDPGDERLLDRAERALADRVEAHLRVPALALVARADVVLVELGRVGAYRLGEGGRQHRAAGAQVPAAAVGPRVLTRHELRRPAAVTRAAAADRPARCVSAVPARAPRVRL